MSFLLFYRLVVNFERLEVLPYHWLRKSYELASNEHLLEEAAFEGLGLGDLGGYGFDFAVEGGEEVGDFGLFGEGGLWDFEEPNTLKVALLARAFFRQFVEEFGGLEEVAEAADGFFLNGGEHGLSLGGVLVDLVEGETVVLENLVGKEVHALGEVFVEDEAEDVVAEFISPHLSPQGVGDVPEAGLEVLLVVFRHG